MFGLKRKKRRKLLEDFPPADPQTILDQQSISRAVAGAVIAVALFNYAWVLSADLFDKIFPWLSMIQGMIVGLAVRRSGRGFDWRFPLIAAVAAWIAAFTANFTIAMMTTSNDLGVSAWQVAGSLTSMTFDVFFTETFNVVDHIYAVSAAAIAAFFSKRQLNRREVLVLRKYQQEANQ